VDGFLALSKQRADQALSAQKKNVKSTYVVITGVIIVTILGIIFMVYMITRAFKDLPVIVKSLKLIAGGDLSTTITITRADEIGDIQKASESMRVQLLNLIKDIISSTEKLSTSSEGMMEIAAETRGQIRIQQVDTEEVATAMNEMTATVQEVSNNILATANAADRANAETQEGQKVMDLAANRIKDLAGQIRQAEETIRKLEQDSINITSVLDVINGVAEQTNLLALNAAIEAARAGEHGRGFAVVADEVRTLASRTQKSTEEIKTMIDNLNHGTREAVEVMNVSCEQAEGVVEQAALASEKLYSILEAVSQINDMSEQISSAAKEQSQVADEINQKIIGITDAGLVTGQSADKIAEETTELLSMSMNLETLIAKFKL
ncbi:MAG: methyl-accepting chemotaxis protein, partial [Gammaproteobacteria bacterium]|nr:methyl-accepting chemotaxis protein [Gammaproteobacteria bacterium]